MTTRSFHMALDVRGAIRNREWRLGGFMVGACYSEGRLLTSDEILDALLQHVAQGHKLIPMCPESDCPEFSYETGCPGHEAK